MNDDDAVRFESPDAEEVVGVAEHPAQLGDLVVAGHGGLELLHRIQVAG